MAWDRSQTNYKSGRGFAWPNTPDTDMDTDDTDTEDTTDNEDDGAVAAHSQYNALVARDRDYYERALPNHILDARERREEQPWWARLHNPTGEILRGVSTNYDWKTYTPNPIKRGPGPSVTAGVVDTIGRGIGNYIARRDAAAEVGGTPWRTTPKKGTQFSSLLGSEGED